MTRRSKVPLVRPRGGLIAALDIGTTKIACLIARLSGEELRVIGFGHQASEGLRRGAIVDLEAAEAAIRATVEQAERMAGENIREVWVNLSAGAPRSRLIAYEIALAGLEIDDSDVRRLFAPPAYADHVGPDHEVIHLIPVGFNVDGARGVDDPRGLFGQRLGVNLHLITAQAGPARNIAACVGRCHLDVAGRVVGGYAAALGCLSDDERTLGVTVIDMGGGTTSMAVFFDGELVHADVVPVGGAQVTSDIAAGLSTPLAQAERVKTLWGSCMPSPSDDRQLIEVPPMGADGSDETAQVPRSLLVNVIRPRLEEIFEMARTRLVDAGFDGVAGRQVVLTGGASQVPGTADLAGMVLGKRVRPGRVRPLPGMPEAATGPAFATAAGLVRYALEHAHEAPAAAPPPEMAPAGRWSRIGQWLKQNF